MAKYGQKIVEVTWQDIACYSGWQDGGDWSPIDVKTVGYVIKKRDKNLYVAQTIEQSGKPGNVFVIPNHNVKNVRVIGRLKLSK